MLGIELWELAIIPYLLYNSETWTDISVSTIALLNEIQLNFYRNILSTPKSCPIPALLWETGGMLMEHRIAKNKIMFYHHIMNLPEDSLAYQIAKMQESLAFPGLIAECKQLLDSYGCMGDPKFVPKQQWKNHYKRVIREKNKSDILQSMKNYKKLDIVKVRQEKFE